MEETKENHFEEEELKEMSLKQLQNFYKERGFKVYDIMTKKDYINSLLENEEYNEKKIIRKKLRKRRFNRKLRKYNQDFYNLFSKI
jgi:hypothetical protein